jgi:hypothetical protein
MASAWVYRSVVVLLWALAALNSAICRGLFWDGASFLAIVLDAHAIRDYYPEREHVAWVTQAPLPLLVELGVRDTRLLAIAYSALLFAWPTGLYHLALARARHDPAMLTAVLAALAAVYVPTSFFIVGEYNVAYAAVLAAVMVALTSSGPSAGSLRRDGAILLALGALCLASYEAMVYLGPLTAMIILWSMRRAKQAEPMDDIARLLWALAALAFLASAAVAGAAIAEYWNHDYFIRVRAASFNFWQNLQFIIPFAGLGLLAAASLVVPSWLQSRAVAVWLGLVALVLAATPFLRLVSPETMLFPPAHYIARTAAGWLVAGLSIALWLYVGWRTRAPQLLTELHRPEVARPLSVAMAVLLFASVVPDLALGRLWVGYLGYFRGLVTSNTGLVRANDLPMQQWPYRLFAQDWTYPALSALLRSAPEQGVVVMDKDYRTNPPFEPTCGTVPRLEGFGWKD